MTPRQKRFAGIMALLVGCGLATALVLYALNRNINLFFTPSDILPVEVTLRVGGVVVAKSVERAKDSLEVKFALMDKHQQIWVVYQGILPDLFREGQAVVAVGQVQKDGILHATQILAKHDENYVPRDLEEILKQQESTP